MSDGTLRGSVSDPPIIRPFEATCKRCGTAADEGSEYCSACQDKVDGERKATPSILLIREVVREVPQVPNPVPNMETDDAKPNP